MNIKSLAQMSGLAGLGNESHRRAPSHSAVGAEAETIDFLESQLEVSQRAAEVSAMELMLFAIADSEERVLNIASSFADKEHGMTRGEANIVNSQVNAYNATTLPKFQIKFPSNESFDGSSRVASTMLGNEVIIDKAKELGKWLYDQLIKMIEAIQGWLDAVFGSAERLKAQAEKLLALADSVTIEDEKRKITIATQLLTKGTTLPSATSIDGLMTDLKGTLSLVTSEGKLVEDYLKEAMALADAKATEIEEKTKDGGSFNTAFLQYTTSPTPVPEADAIGGKFVSVANESRAVATVATKLAKDSVEIVILPPNKCKTILESAIKVAELAIDSKKKYGDKKKLANEIKKAGESISSTTGDKDTTAEQKAAFRLVTSALTKSSKASVNGVATSWLAHSISVAGEATKVCGKSLK